MSDERIGVQGRALGGCLGQGPRVSVRGAYGERPEREDERFLPENGFALAGPSADPRARRSGDRRRSSTHIPRGGVRGVGRARPVRW